MKSVFFSFFLFLFLAFHSSSSSSKKQKTPSSSSFHIRAFLCVVCLYQCEHLYRIKWICWTIETKRIVAGSHMATNTLLVINMILRDEQMYVCVCMCFCALFWRIILNHCWKWNEDNIKIKKKTFKRWRHGICQSNNNVTVSVCLCLKNENKWHNTSKKSWNVSLEKWVYLNAVENQ